MQQQKSLWEKHLPPPQPTPLTKKEKRMQRKNNKKNTQIYPEPSSKSFGVVEDHTRISRTKSTGPGRLQTNTSFSIHIDPMESPRNARSGSISPRASDFSFGEVQDQDDINDIEQIINGRNSNRSFVEHEPGYGQGGANDVNFGGGRGYSRRQDDAHGLGVADSEWEDIVSVKTKLFRKM